MTEKLATWFLSRFTTNKNKTFWAMTLGTFLAFSKELDGVGPLITDPPPSIFTTMSEEEEKS